MNSRYNRSVRGPVNVINIFTVTTNDVTKANKKSNFTADPDYLVRNLVFG